MRTITEETIIKAAPEQIWKFLTNLHKNGNYKKWHPKDHISYTLRKGSMGEVGGVAYFEEHLGRFTLKLSYLTIKAQYPHYLEYVAAPPLGWLRAGKGTFTMKPIDNEYTRFIAYAEYGYHIPILSQLFDWIAEKIVPVAIARKHIIEEGENIKRLLEL